MLDVSEVFFEEPFVVDFVQPYIPFISETGRELEQKGFDLDERTGTSRI